MGKIDKIRRGGSAVEVRYFIINLFDLISL